MPITLYFDRAIADRGGGGTLSTGEDIEAVVGAWYWDGWCRLAPECRYFSLGTTGLRARRRASPAT
jgi:hypothetical protein